MLSPECMDLLNQMFTLDSDKRCAFFGGGGTGRGNECVCVGGGGGGRRGARGGAWQIRRVSSREGSSMHGPARSDVYTRLRQEVRV
jgi:hypothetical protein